MPGARDDATLCRHTADTAALEALMTLLRELPQRAPQLLQAENIPALTYDDLLKMAIESMRGTQSANPRAKRRFINAVLTHLRSTGVITSWEYIGSGGRQDFRVEMPGLTVAIEAKGCGDGNNMTIWDRPAWADEFILWSLCPESLQHNPGHGVWSAISTRLTPKIIIEQKPVDAFVFYDQRCGSDIRPCPKACGAFGIRANAADVEGQLAPIISGGGCGADWLPPPSIYLFPRTVPQAPTNPSPRPNSIATCRFANALLTAFNVPPQAMSDIVSSVHISVELRHDGIYRRVAIHHGRSTTPAVDSGWTRLRR